jgi:hypothetical protein
VPTSGKVYKVSVSGWRKVQAITVATLGNTVALTSTFANSPDAALISSPGRNRELVGTISGNGQSVTIDTGGFEQLAINLTGTVNMTWVAEWTEDGTNWVQDNAGIDNATDIWSPGTLVQNDAVARVFYTDVSTVRAYRIRSTAWTSGTLTVTFTAARGVAVGYSFFQNPPPHKFGYTQKSKTVQLTGSSTGTDVMTVTSGKTLIITSIQIQAGGTVAGAVQVYFGTGTYSRGTNNAIFDGEFAPSATSKPGVIQTGVWNAGAASTQLRVASAAAINPLTITVWGYEAN